jgi:ADP-L-glycero-D-manno-heptose 6-epimerase
MRILVTGGSGFIGGNIVKALIAEGHAITSIDHRDSHTIIEGVTHLRGDVSDPTFWQQFDDQFEAVLHQAACADTTVYDEEFMMRQNFHAFKALLQWAVERGTDVVYASSAAVYGSSKAPQTVGVGEEPLNVYGRSKLAMDQLLRSKMDSLPIKVIGLRYFNVYGPGEMHKGKMASMIYQLAQQMKAGNRPKIFTDGTQRRDQIYVEDIVQANLCALKADKQASGVYNAGTGSSVSFNEIIAALNTTLGLSLEPEYIENPYTAVYQDLTQADITPTREKLSFEPSYDLQKGVDAYAASGML